MGEEYEVKRCDKNKTNHLFIYLWRAQVRVEFIEASLGVVESSFQLGLRFCGMGGLKDNVIKSNQGVVEGRVLHVHIGRRAQSQQGPIRRKQRGQGQKIVTS